MKNKDEKKSFAERYLGIPQRPTMSSWAREQLAKEQGVSEDQLNYINSLPTKEDIIKANKKSQRKRNLLIILVVVIIILYEYVTGSSLVQQIMGTPQQNTQNIAIAEGTEYKP